VSRSRIGSALAGAYVAWLLGHQERKRQYPAPDPIGGLIVTALTYIIRFIAARLAAVLG
jgi:hypothetical protein